MAGGRPREELEATDSRSHKSLRSVGKFEVWMTFISERSKVVKSCSYEIIGTSFTVDKVKTEDLEAGYLKTSWGLESVHQAVSEVQASALLKAVAIGTLLSSAKGAWDISDELNQLFPEHEFTPIEDFLAKAWEGKP